MSVWVTTRDASLSGSGGCSRLFPDVEMYRQQWVFRGSEERRRRSSRASKSTRINVKGEGRGLGRKEKLQGKVGRHETERVRAVQCSS